MNDASAQISVLTLQPKLEAIGISVQVQEELVLNIVIVMSKKYLSPGSATRMSKSDSSTINIYFLIAESQNFNIISQHTISNLNL